MRKPALLIIDMQNDFVLADKPLQVTGALGIIPTIQDVLDAFRTYRFPVFHVVRVHRPDGSDVEIMRKDLFSQTPFAVEGSSGAAVIDALAPRSDEYLLPKIRMSAFIGTGLDLTLRTLGIDGLVVTGIQTPNCIRTTVFDAMAYNYPVWLVNDATAARNSDIHEQNVRDMAAIGVTVQSASETCSMIAGLGVHPEESAESD
jgi:nicotinamidase-related amidase